MRPVALREAVEEAHFGGKAVSLGAALRAGLPVPDGAALPFALVDAVAEGSATAREAASSLAARLDGALAVRSSAVGEDGAGTSFAGQHLSLLGVVGAPALLDAVAAVRASAHAPSALGYRQRMGLAGAPRMGVVVQRLVDAEVAGVLFTRNPMDGSDERVIEASWGLGESVVAGRVTPDFFRVSRDGAVLERRAGEKDTALHRARDGGVREEVVDAERAIALCLDDEKLRALDALARLCEEVFGGTQDIEWAFAGGALTLLQRRPITVSR